MIHPYKNENVTRHIFGNIFTTTSQLTSSYISTRASFLNNFSNLMTKVTYDTINFHWLKKNFITFFFASPIVNISMNFAIWSARGDTPKPHHSMSLQGIATSKIKNFSHICLSVRGHHHQVLKIFLLILSQNALVMSLQLPSLRQSVWFPPCPEFRTSSVLLLTLSPFLYSLSALFLFCCMIPAKLKKINTWKQSGRPSKQLYYV